MHSRVVYDSLFQIISTRITRMGTRLRRAHFTCASPQYRKRRPARTTSGVVSTTPAPSETSKPWLKRSQYSTNLPKGFINSIKLHKYSLFMDIPRFPPILHCPKIHVTVCVAMATYMKHVMHNISKVTYFVQPIEVLTRTSKTWNFWCT